MNMTEQEFAKLLDIHGSDAANWPAGVRAGMHRLCAQSAQARELLEHARAFDELMSATCAPPARAGLEADILAAAGIATPAQQLPAARPANDNAPSRWLVGGMLAASLALGIWLGGFGPLAGVGETILGASVRTASLDDGGLAEILDLASEPDGQGGIL